MSTVNLLGIDLGTAKCGVCWVGASKIVFLKTVASGELVQNLDYLSSQHGPCCVVVVDVAINAGNGSGFRLIDRVFMRGLFNNNNCGIQPNNPDLLNMGAEFETLREWCTTIGVSYCNDFPVEGGKCPLLETLPHAALGILCDSARFMQAKRRLRFRYGRGANVAPITVGFECLIGTSSGFFDPLTNAPQSWESLEQFSGVSSGKEQADDLISAVVCATLACWVRMNPSAGYVRCDQGHYVLPPSHLVHQTWRSEIGRILKAPEFGRLTTNFEG